MRELRPDEAVRLLDEERGGERRQEMSANPRAGGRLRRCEDCGGMVSMRAEACPFCGCPICRGEDLVDGRRVQTIERTAKKYKRQILFGGGLALLGVGLMIASMGEGGTGMGIGSVLFVGGLIYYAIARGRAWWHHG